MEPKLDVALVVVSCDKYSDLWEAFFDMFFMNWPDCPFPVYLAANKKSSLDSRVITLLGGEDTDWSSSVRRCIENLSQKYIFFWIDDAFLSEKVNTSEVLRVMKKALDMDCNCVRFRSEPKPDVWIDDEIGELGLSELYRVSLFSSLWRKEDLLKILKDGESAWDFELAGSERSKILPRFYSVKKDMFTYIHGVERGRWIRPAALKLKKMGYSLDLNYRSMMTIKEDVAHRYRRFKTHVLHCTPPRYRKDLMSFVRAIYKTFGVR